MHIQGKYRQPHEIVLKLLNLEKSQFKNKTMANSSEFSVVITTTSSTDEAEKIARALLNIQLVACVQVYPMKSFYSWKGEICADDEIILLIKAKSANYKEIESCIKSNHSYEVPEIIQLPIFDGSNSYLEWINQVSK